jgi:ABC-2 type transport system ATP-binding protein
MRADFPPSQAILRTEQLTKDYGRFRALDHLDLAVKKQEIFGILGPNGSGKTTALRLLLGFLRPTSGRAFLGPHDCWKDSVAARRLVVYLPGELRLYETMTGRQLIRFLCELRGQAVTREVDELAGLFEIDLDRPLTHLSSGMKRKVALLHVFAPRTPVIIMDEPTNTLDPAMRDALLKQVRRARDRGQTVVFSSHVLAEVEQVCDRVAILREGKLAHLQDMSALHEGRLVQIHFHQAAPAPPALEGLCVLEHKGECLTLEYTGELSALLGWLGQQPVADLRLEPLGLKAVYLRHHGRVANDP